MNNIFTTIFFQPVLNLLVFIYDIIPFNDFGVAVVLLTIVIKLIFWPLGGKSIKSQKALQDLQPKINEIKEKYKDDKVESSKKIMELYKQNKINPFSSCLPLLIQLPFLWAVYRIFRTGLDNNLDLVYPFISRPESINTVSLGLVDLANPNVYLAVLAGAAQFWQAKMLSHKKPAVKTPGAKDENMMAIMNKQMLFIMPAVTVFIGLSLPGGLTLYWLVITLVTALQQFFIFRQTNKSPKEQSVIEGEVVEEKEDK
jgi:YidC/Oxa1 family membrane protein insertase